MNECFLSNLTVASNLLTIEHHQTDMWHCSVFELIDIFQRCPGLDPGRSYLPERLRDEFRRHLFWGQAPFPEVDSKWPLEVWEPLLAAYQRFQVRPELELAWEILAISRSFLTTYDSIGTSNEKLVVTRIDRNVRDALNGPEFRLTPDFIESRLSEITGTLSHEHRRY